MMGLAPALMALLVLAGAGAVIAGVVIVIARVLPRGAPPHDAAAAITDLRARLESLEVEVENLRGVDGRVAELEERLDFTERVLAQRREHRLSGDVQ